jgi:probable addiction module antidote protein
MEGEPTQRSYRHAAFDVDDADLTSGGARSPTCCCAAAKSPLNSGHPQGKGSTQGLGGTTKTIAAFDAADYLDSELVIAEYLNAALEDENPDVFLQAIADVAKARGMTQLAKDTGLGRESLYKALAPGAKPRYNTVIRLVRALGVELHTTPAAQS